MVVFGKIIVRNRYAKLTSLKNHSVHFTTSLRFCQPQASTKLIQWLSLRKMTMNPVVRACSFVEEPPELFQCGVCQLVLRDPQITEYCRKNACRHCKDEDVGFLYLTDH